MEERMRSKIFLKREIRNIYSKPKRQWQNIGRINLVSYYKSKNDISHLEFELNEEWRNQGIMSKELPKYLKYCKKYGHNRLIALVKENNLASIKLLEKNGFLKFKKIGDIIFYIIHLDIRYSKMLEKIIKTTHYLTKEEKITEIKKIAQEYSEKDSMVDSGNLFWGLTEAIKIIEELQQKNDSLIGEFYGFRKV